MSRFEQDGLIIEVEEHATEATVHWLGVSDAREPGRVLMPYLESLVATLVGKSVTVDFRRFKYMNSATVSPIINFVKQLDAKGIPTVLHFDASLNWQRLNAQCLRAMAGMMRQVEVRT